MTERDAYVRVSFPSGTSFAIRCECTGVVIFEDRPVDDDLAARMLFLKAWKLQIVTPMGSA